MNIIDIHTHVGDIVGGDNVSLLARLSAKLMYANVYLGKINYLFYKKMQESMLAVSKKAVAVELIRSMNKSGVDFSVIVALEPKVPTDTVIKEARNHKTLIPFMSVHPDDPEKLKKIKTYYSKGCLGIKLHPVIQDFSPLAKGAYEIYEEAQKLGLPILFHTGFFPCKKKYLAMIDNFYQIPKDFPRLKIIAGHMNMFEPTKATHFCKRFENVFLEISKQPKLFIRKAIKSVGDSKILFGSDWPFGSQELSLKIVEKATKGKSTIMEKILFSNAKTLLSFKNVSGVKI